MVRGLVVFGVTYALVASRRLRLVQMDRPAGALVGAVLAVVLGAVTPRQAAEAVDQTTIVLLLAVMGMGAFLEDAGVVDRVGAALLARARTRRRLVAYLVWGAGALGALVTNDAVCVLLAPLVVSWISRYELPRLPLLVALATGANTGSVATLVGNPQNMLCGSLGHLEFRAFSAHLVPVAVVALAINHALVVLLFRRELDGPLPEVPAPERLLDARGAFTVGVIACTVVSYLAGANLAFAALAGFVVLMLSRPLARGEVWTKIDWSILLFFGALFVAVEALAQSGAPARIFAAVPPWSGEGAAGWARAAVVFLVGSNVVTNVPFILIAKPEMAGRGAAGWELLAMTSTFAGNLTLLGSVANVIVAEKAEKVGGLRFWEYARAGVPISLATTIAGAAVLYVLR